MTTKRKTTIEHVELHKDGSVWAKGKMLDGSPVGYWEWFRKDGTKLRSGHFDGGAQVGEWITYDRKGSVYKVTGMKPKTEKTKTRAGKAGAPSQKRSK